MYASNKTNEEKVLEFHLQLHFSVQITAMKQMSKTDTSMDRNNDTSLIVLIFNVMQSLVSEISDKYDNLRTLMCS